MKMFKKGFIGVDPKRYDTLEEAQAEAERMMSINPHNAYYALGTDGKYHKDLQIPGTLPNQQEDKS